MPTNVSLSRGKMKLRSNCPEADLSQVLKGRIVKLGLARGIIGIAGRDYDDHALAGAG